MSEPSLTGGPFWVVEEPPQEISLLRAVPIILGDTAIPAMWADDIPGLGEGKGPLEGL